MEHGVRAKTEALGFIADCAMILGVILAVSGIIATYFNLAYAVRIEGFALISIAASVIVTFRGISAALKGS